MPCTAQGRKMAQACTTISWSSSHSPRTRQYLSRCKSASMKPFLWLESASQYQYLSSMPKNGPSGVWDQDMGLILSFPISGPAVTFGFAFLCRNAWCVPCGIWKCTSTLLVFALFLFFGFWWWKARHNCTHMWKCSTVNWISTAFIFNFTFALYCPSVCLCRLITFYWGSVA